MKIFGTDGIRGKVGEKPIIVSIIKKIAYTFANTIFQGKKGLIYISNDGRESSQIIQNALFSGISHQGSKCCNVGLLSTPAMSLCLNKLNKDLIAGIQITASHNPYHDNGMKFFNQHGFKINNIIENTIENDYKYLSEIPDYVDGLHKDYEIFTTMYSNIINEYIGKKIKKTSIKEDKFNILIDCANGATSKLITSALNNNIFTVTSIFDEPDGKNINQNCGATNPNIIKDFIKSFNSIEAISTHNKQKKIKIDLGVALDGDGDRAIFISSDGEIINGDDVLYILAKYNKEKNNIQNPVVGTVMTNHGIQSLYKKLNIKFIEAKVGDKHVVEEMIKNNSYIGGESSGHIIINDFNNLYVGDGIITMINLISALINIESSLSELKQEIQLIPSKLINIKIKDKLGFMRNQNNIKVMQELENQINNRGRIVLRPSGTEELIRLLIEHENESEIKILLDYFYDNINKT